jgi:hypothetical protein
VSEKQTFLYQQIVECHRQYAAMVQSHGADSTQARLLATRLAALNKEYVAVMTPAAEADANTKTNTIVEQRDLAIAFPDSIDSHPEVTTNNVMESVVEYTLSHAADPSEEQFRKALPDEHAEGRPFDQNQIRQIEMVKDWLRRELNTLTVDEIQKLHATHDIILKKQNWSGVGKIAGLSTRDQAIAQSFEEAMREASFRLKECLETAKNHPPKSRPLNAPDEAIKILQTIVPQDIRILLLKGQQVSYPILSSMTEVQQVRKSLEEHSIAVSISHLQAVNILSTLAPTDIETAQLLYREGQRLLQILASSQLQISNLPEGLMRDLLETLSYQMRFHVPQHVALSRLRPHSGWFQAS